MKSGSYVTSSSQNNCLVADTALRNNLTKPNLTQNNCCKFATQVRFGQDYIPKVDKWKVYIHVLWKKYSNAARLTFTPGEAVVPLSTMCALPADYVLSARTLATEVLTVKAQWPVRITVACHRSIVKVRRDGKSAIQTEFRVITGK